MKNLIIILLTALLVLPLGCGSPKTETKKINAKILLKVDEGTIDEAWYEQHTENLTNRALGRVLKKYDVPTLRSVFKNRYNASGRLRANMVRKTTSAINGWFGFSVDMEEEAINDMLAELRNVTGVLSANREIPIPVEADAEPDDTLYGLQWHLDNPTNPEFDISAEDAWDINTGRSDVIIAVLDGGVAYDHPDLDPGDRSRIIQGYDTGENDNNPYDDLPDGEGSFGNHGTQIAGVIGAIANNNQQVAGVMWDCKIMPVKIVRNGSQFFDMFGWDWEDGVFPSDAADGIDYAVNNGADIITLSYSFPSLGYPVDDAHQALQLLDEPNELYHWTAGGNGTKNYNFPQWALLSGRWGLAAATYYDVDSYKVETHVTFDVPFCEPPMVWMRNRESETISGANPNNGKPWASITNVTETGFDLKYFTYFVRTNASGQQINQWVPAEPSSTNFQYTAVGEPNNAALAGPVSGNSLMCTSDQKTYTLANVPSGASVEWRRSSNLKWVSGRFTPTVTAKHQSGKPQGAAWVRPVITGSCGEELFLDKYHLWVGEPADPTSMSGASSVAQNSWEFYEIPEDENADSYNWVLPSGWSHHSSSNPSSNRVLLVTGANSGYVRARASNSCGNSNHKSKYVTVTGGGCGSPVCYSLAPNPASSSFVISANETTRDGSLAATNVDLTEPYEIDIFNQAQERVMNCSSRESALEVDVRDFKEGLYIVHIRYKEVVSKHKLVVRKE